MSLKLQKLFQTKKSLLIARVMCHWGYVPSVPSVTWKVKLLFKQITLLFNHQFFSLISKKKQQVFIISQTCQLSNITYNVHFGAFWNLTFWPLIYFYLTETQRCASKISWKYWEHQYLLLNLLTFNQELSNMKQYEFLEFKMRMRITCTGEL